MVPVPRQLSPAWSGLVGPASGRWRGCLGRLAHSAFHLPQHAVRDAGLVGGEPVAYLYQQGGEVLMMPLVLREVPGGSGGWRDAASPSGYPGPIASTSDAGFWKAALAGLRTVLAARGVISCFVRTTPVLPAPHEALLDAGVLVQHGETVSVDLRRRLEAVVADFRTSTRQQVERSRQAGHVVDVDRTELWPAFVDAYLETMQRVGAAAPYSYSQDWFDDVGASLGREAHLLTVSSGGELLGGGVFLEAAGIVDYYLSGVRRSALDTQPTKLLLDAACRWASARGAVELHLGGGAGGGPQDGLLHFKRGFSSRLFPFHTWRLVVDEAAYQRLVGPASLDDRAFFPAYRAPAADSSA